MDNNKRFYHRFKSNKEEISKMNEELNEILISWEIKDKRVIFDSTLIIFEALRNSLEHGNKYNEDKEIILKMKLFNNSKLIASVKDEGEGFNYKCVMSQNCENTERGMGLKLISGMTDSFKFNSKGNLIIMVKGVA